MTMTNIARMTEAGLTVDEASELYEEIKDDAADDLRTKWADTLHDDLIYETADMIAAVATEEQAVSVSDGDAEEGDDPFISVPAYEQVERAAECYHGTGQDGALHYLLEEDLLYQWTASVERALESAAGRALRVYLRQ